MFNQDQFLRRSRWKTIRCYQQYHWSNIKALPQCMSLDAPQLLQTEPKEKLHNLTEVVRHLVKMEKISQAGAWCGMFLESPASELRCVGIVKIRKKKIWMHSVKNTFLKTKIRILEMVCPTAVCKEALHTDPGTNPCWTQDYAHGWSWFRRNTDLLKWHRENLHKSKLLMN